MIDLLPRATLLMGVPTFYVRLLASPRLTRTVCAGMRLFVSGSAPLLARTHAEFEARTGHRVLERYGMTETGMYASNPLLGERRPGSVGPALPGVSLRVADRDGVAACRGRDRRARGQRAERAVAATGATRKRPPSRSGRTAGSSPAISRRSAPTATSPSSGATRI